MPASATTSSLNVGATLSLTNNPTYYAITKKVVIVTFNKGANVSAVGAASGTCTIQNTATNCSMVTPSITPNTGYTSVGWNTTNGATTGTVAGSNITGLTANTTYYANALDKTSPTISLNPNTQTTYVSGGKAVTVTLADSGSGLKASQPIYYAWSTSNATVPSSWSSVTSTNAAGAKSATVTVPATSSASLTGTYYLWIKAGTLSDVSGNTSNQVISALFKFDNIKPTGTIIFNGQKGDSSASGAYIVGPTFNSAPYASSITNDEHSNIKSSSLSCSSSNHTIAVPNIINQNKVDINIQQTKGSEDPDYHYLQEDTIVTCTLDITDNAGNTTTVSNSEKFGNGWFSNNSTTCSNGNSIKTWNFISGMKKITGWVYTYWTWTNANIYYYFDSEGTMLRGWQKINGTWYFFYGGCDLSYTIGSGYYYPDGGMLWNDSITDANGNKWTFGSNGACTSGSGC